MPSKKLPNLKIEGFELSVFKMGQPKLTYRLHFIKKEKEIIIPDDILQNYLSAEEITAYKQSGTGIYSITVYAEKPAACCGTDCCK